MIQNSNIEETMGTESAAGEMPRSMHFGGRARRKVMVGRVVSNKMSKSIVVTIARRVKHPLYKKYLTKTARFMVHDQNNDAKVGDTVKIMETRPLSRRKRWRLVEIVEKAK